ncbi:MAG: RNA-binding cell elongation regulator Jag/EloR [Chloroflexota bacterium]|nr:RNA-binding cell elongation regulator Jag/EloR [Chloroflexota bacterium]
MLQDKQVLESAGEDVDAAIAAGLTRLDLPRDAVEVEVLDEGRQGMFGLGARAARVRLTVRPEAKRKPEREPERKPEPQPRPSSPPPSPPAEEAEQAKSVPEERREVATEGQELTEEEEKIEAVRKVVEGLLDAMHFDDAQVEIQRAEAGPNKDEVPPLVVDVSGPDTDTLIGTDGEVLDTFQYITRLLVGRKMKGWVHVVVDVQGYKAKRADRLRDLAHRMAEQAADTDRAVILQPMPPHERRVVHVALYDDPRVTTESIYEGERRRVTILPKE